MGESEITKIKKSCLKLSRTKSRFFHEKAVFSRFSPEIRSTGIFPKKGVDLKTAKKPPRDSQESEATIPELPDRKINDKAKQELTLVFVRRSA